MKVERTTKDSKKERKEERKMTATGQEQKRDREEINLPEIYEQTFIIIMNNIK